MHVAKLAIALAASIGSAATVAAQVPAAGKVAGKSFVVPFELLPSRHMVVEAKLNGKGPYRFVFDTGAPINLLTTMAARDAGVLDEKARPAFPLFGMMGAKNVRSLKLGGAESANVAAVVMDHPTVAEIGRAYGPIEGIVGFPFFARYATTIDYRKKELTLVPNGYEPTDFMERMMATVLKATEQKGEARVAAPAGLWGFAVEKAKGDEDAGVTVTEAFVGGPAAAAGLKVGDRLLTLEGRWTDSAADVSFAAGSVKPGREAVLAVRRDGKEVKLTVKCAMGF